MTQNVSIAILADSSAAVAGQWQHILRDYIGPSLARLINGYPRQLSIAFVTYALADTKPSPIIARRYFSHPNQVTKELKEEPSKLGLGSTTTGGRTGMAILEGYAAVLEMFDLLQKQDTSSNKENMAVKPTSDAQPQIYHIFHICAGLPNEMVHPCYNQSTELDSLSWRTLPEELKKRNINLNLFMLRTSQKLSELHSASVIDPCPTWFTVRPGHSILLSSQSLWALPSGAAKRKEDQLNDNPETKRVRINSPKDAQSPSISASQPKATQPLESKTMISTNQSQSPPPQSQSQPQNRAQARPNNQPLAKNMDATTPHANQITVLRRLQVLEDSLKKQVAELARLSQQQSTEASERRDNLKKSIPQGIQVLKKMKEQYAQRFGGMNPANDNSNPTVSAAQNTKTGNTGPARSVPSTSNSHAHPLSAPSDGQSLAQFVQARQAQQTSPEPKPTAIAANSNSTAGPAPIRPGPPPATIPSHLVAQMQKLASKEGIPGQSQMPLLKTPTVTQTQLPPQQGGQQMATALPTASLIAGDPNRWRGAIAWAMRENNDSQVMKMEAHVIAASKGGQTSIRPDLWPRVLEIRLSTQQAVPMQDLKVWIGQHKPAICSISRDPSIPDNNNRFLSFCQLLFEKRTYAIGSWVTPGANSLRPTILIFSAGLIESVVGLVFPETGLPDIPKPLSAVPVQPQPPVQMQAQPANQLGPSNPAANNVPSVTPAQVQALIQKLGNTPGMNFPAQQVLAMPFEQQVLALQNLQRLKLRQQQNLQLQLQAQAARGNPVTMNASGIPWGQTNPQGNLPQGFNAGINNSVGGQAPNLGFSGFNMNQAAQMLPKGFNMSGQNMNLMNLNAMNMGAGMQLGTLGGMASGTGAMQQPQRPGQPTQGGAQPNAGESVQAFLQRNGLAGGMR